MTLLLRIFMIFFALYAQNTVASPPGTLITHNMTPFESNAYIDGNIPSAYPTKAYSTNKVLWLAVRIACLSHTTHNKCMALVKMQTDTAYPIDIGWIEIDLTNGDMQPKQLHGNGYTLTVNGPAEVTLTED